MFSFFVVLSRFRDFNKNLAVQPKWFGFNGRPPKKIGKTPWFSIFHRKSSGSLEFFSPHPAILRWRRAEAPPRSLPASSCGTSVGSPGAVKASMGGERWLKNTK